MASDPRTNEALQPSTIPAVFVSHGSPMVAIQTGPYQDALAQFGRTVRPRAILAISAHWGSSTTISVAGVARNRTICDFGGFPALLYELTYSAPGDPELASHIVGLLNEHGFQAAVTNDRGLDHGTWIPLRLMYPEADIPFVRMSVPLQLTPEELFKIGQALAPFHEQGVMILGSGGIVHNLRLVHFEDRDFPVERWAAEFDRWFADAVEQMTSLTYSATAPRRRMRSWRFQPLNTSRRSLLSWARARTLTRSRPSAKDLSMETSPCAVSQCLRKCRQPKPACSLHQRGSRPRRSAALPFAATK